ncbi:MAG: hypothetical protein C4584_00790 [Armatimonadetes bacterium]|nr:MAG: hypothetical protein C4584_00790 [Armatimonadota bacterium]
MIETLVETSPEQRDNQTREPGLHLACPLLESEGASSIRVQGERFSIHSAPPDERFLTEMIISQLKKYRKKPLICRICPEGRQFPKIDEDLGYFIIDLDEDEGILLVPTERPKNGVY